MCNYLSGLICARVAFPLRIPLDPLCIPSSKCNGGFGEKTHFYQASSDLLSDAQSCACSAPHTCSGLHMVCFPAESLLKGIF